MIAVLRRYPTIVYQLLFLLLVLFVVSGLLERNYIHFEVSDIGYMDWSYWAGILGIFVAGLLADMVRSVQKGLMISLVVMVFGTIVLSLLPFGASVVVGSFLAKTGFHVFYFLVLIHLAVLFPVATDWKDNAYMLVAATAWLSGVLFSIIYLMYEVSGRLDYSWSPNIGIGLLILVLTILLAWAIFRNSKIGYNISDEGDEPEAENSKWPILAGLVLVYSTFTIAGFALPKIADVNGQMPGYLFGDLGPLLMWVLSLMIFLAGVAIIGFTLHFTQNQSLQYSKIVWAIGVLMAFAAVMGATRLDGNTGLGMTVMGAISFINTFFVLPALLSVATHVNLGKHTGLWLGTLIGAPQVLAQLVFLVPENALSGLAHPAIALVLLAVCFIFLRENKDRILEMLALEETNQEREESLPENPDDEIMDHLVGP